MKSTITTTFKFYVIGLLISIQINANAQSDKLFGLIGEYLVEVDILTGEATEIGQIDSIYLRISGFTYEPNLQKILAVSDFDTSPKLISIDPSNGNVQEVGTIFQEDPFVELKWIESLTYNHVNGLLYGAGNETGQPSNKIFTIDPQTGKATIADDLVTNTCEGGDVDALLASQTTSYATDGCFGMNEIQLYTINLNNGGTSFVNSIPFDTYIFLTAINLTNGDFYLASPVNGIERNLFKYSISDGQIELIGETHDDNEFNGGYLTRLTFASVNPTSTSNIFDNGNEINIYPNPSNGIFTINMVGDFQYTELRIFNSIGHQIRTFENNDNNEVHIKNLSSGIYFVSILKNNELLMTKKIIIKNEY